MRLRLIPRLTPLSTPYRACPTTRARQWANNPSPAVPYTPNAAIHHSKAMSSSSKTTAPAANDATKSAAIQAELAALTEAPHGKWQLHDSPRRLERSFTFPDFAAAWAFMAAVATECEARQHHPEWSNVYNQVFVRWTTHRSPGGVRKKDRELAARCDELASAHGVLEEGAGSGAGAGGGGGGAAPGGGLAGLVGAVSDSARDCCADGSAGGECAHSKV